MFCDDEEENIRIAKNLGIQAILISGIEDFRKVESEMSHVS